MKVWLADLTYTQQTIASDVVPAAVAMIAEYVAANMADPPEFRVFKFPEDLAAALQDDRPDVLGVSNYVWNSRLSGAFCRRVKETWPEVVTVMGGPNFPAVADEQEDFARAHPWVDYFVMKEGELPFLRLLEHLRGTGMSTRCPPADLPNVIHRDPDGAIVLPTRVERLMDLQAIPSPYLSGLLDSFLDGRLLPVVQTNRGCPFTCSFCTEGQSYWSKVRRKSFEQIAEEIRYISAAMARLPVEKRRGDLLIADSNFAMFEEDLEVCRVIAAEQATHGYPKYLNVATGKNRKERVLEAARLVNGAMKLAGSVQSLDPIVQENIKRKNISAEQIVELALKSAEIGANTYSEIILALPGDTLDAHFSTLKTLIESGFNMLSMYQLMVLPGTELGLRSTKQHFGMVCRYRVLPRCFGVYEILGQKVGVSEIEEICVANNTLSYDDYLRCRRMNFIVNLFYNDGVFSELGKLLTLVGLSRWDWLHGIYARPWSEDFDAVTTQFVEETEAELWDDQDALAAETSRPEVIERYLAGEAGNNLIFRFKAISLTDRFAAVSQVALDSIRAFLAEQRPDQPELVALAEDVVAFKRMQIEDLFTDPAPRRHVFRYDVPRFAALAAETAGFDAAALRHGQPVAVEFRHSGDQRQLIDSYVSLFGADIRGLSRILSRIFLKQLFRQPVG